MVTAPGLPRVPQAKPDQLDLAALHALLGAIPDPEVPVITIADLGVLRSVDLVDGQVVVTITPTYSGCPAMQHIEDLITEVLGHAGVDGRVHTAMSPAWSTSWMTQAGREKLRSYGIAPPPAGSAGGGIGSESTVLIRGSVPCPLCASHNTAVISEFGSTACKALYRCLVCHEPFDYFKEF